MRKDKVFWKKEVVGFLLNGRMDNFDLYGEWEPLASVHHDEFIACIEADEDEDEVYVCVGSNEKGRIGNVADIPDEQISIRCRGSYTDINSVQDTEDYYRKYLHY